MHPSVFCVLFLSTKLRDITLYLRTLAIMTIATSRKTSLEINFGAIVTVLYSYPIFFASYSCSVQRKHDFKIELNGRLSVLRPYQVSHVVRNRPSVLLLAWHEWFSCKGIKNTRCIAAGSRCRQNLKYENFTSSFGRLRQKKKLHQKACRTCSTIILLHSTSHFIVFRRCRRGFSLTGSLRFDDVIGNRNAENQ